MVLAWYFMVNEAIDQRWNWVLDRIGLVWVDDGLALVYDGMINDKYR